MTDDATRLYLLRHAEVASHQGDVPITDLGERQARRAGEWLAQQNVDAAAVLYGGTRRTRETAEGIVESLAAAGHAGAADLVPRDSFALRNPDLYLAGERVTMVSGADRYAEQVPQLSADEVTAVPFFATWLTHPERVGFWVAHEDPPGDTAATVARRIATFARSLADAAAWRGRAVVAVTHSPILRAVARDTFGEDPGEPEYLSGFEYTVLRNGTHTVSRVRPSI